jgi:tetratricopeptide (TPR) repeat protein
MKIKTLGIFTVVLLINFFVLIPNIFAQQQYNHFALEHLRRSLEYLLVGDYNNAILSSNQLIRFDPHSAVNYLIRARAFYEMNDFDRAIADCNHAIRLDRHNTAALVIRGNAHAQKGDERRAITDWEAALRLNPNLQEARQNLEMLRQQRNN